MLCPPAKTQLLSSPFCPQQFDFVSDKTSQTKVFPARWMKHYTFLFSWLQTLFVFQNSKTHKLFTLMISYLFRGDIYCSTIIPPNSRILRPEIFGNVSLAPRVFSTKSGFQTRYLLNDKNSELENFREFGTAVREGLV